MSFCRKSPRDFNFSKECSDILPKVSYNLDNLSMMWIILSINKKNFLNFSDPGHNFSQKVLSTLYMPVKIVKSYVKYSHLNSMPERRHSIFKDLIPSPLYL